MIVSMKARWFRTWTALVAAAALLLPSLALAQESEASWEDAPAEGEAAVPEAAAPSSAPAQQYEDRDPAALTDFAAELEPYGYWRDDPTYGRVWVPHRRVVGPDFAPYVTSGHWAVADDGGWLWVSDYPFGWVTFHYGRWVWISSVGWSWIPGRQYAHAWVVWRVGDPGYAYVGWAPMPPEYVWFDGFAVGIWFGLYTPWVFCPSAYVYHHHMHSYVLHDHHLVHSVGTHSHRYAPPRGAPPWAGPSPKHAHVPASAVPTRHTPAHPKAVAASRPSGNAAARVVRPGGRSQLGSGTRSVRPMPRPGVRLSRPRTLSGTSDQPLRSTRPSGVRVTPRATGPSRSYSPSYGYGSRPSAPSRAVSPSRSSAPSRSVAPSRSSAPSRSAPPSRSYSPGSRVAPTVAPVPSYRPAPPKAGRPGRSRRR